MAETQRKGSRVYQSYDDILSRIAEEPVWFDEHAVPRYCKFAPDNLANIYAGEAALAEVTCQVCKRLFRVAFSRSGTIADAIRSRTLHFGEHPNVKCCGNAHMNSEPRILSTGVATIRNILEARGTAT
jgi:hypothetical protein